MRFLKITEILPWNEKKSRSPNKKGLTQNQAFSGNFYGFL